VSDGRQSEFFVGYLPQQPPATARRVRGAVLAVSAAGLLLAGVLVLGQQPLPEAAFDYGRARPFSGTLQERPVPTLWAGAASPDGYLLVAPGKHGAGMLVAGLEGRGVDLQGKLIQRDGVGMIEIVPGTLRPSGAAGPAPPAAERLGRVRLVGEIVDGKCYLGVMRPGEGKVHRDCAARCISGGAPPMLAVRTGPRTARLVSLAGSRGESVHAQLLDYVAEPVTIEGELIRHGDQFGLYADLATLRRAR
jgi:hypothetical protein